MSEVNSLIAAAPNSKARLIMLEQWRAGLRVSEALALESRDLHLDSDRPTLVVRQGKGHKARVVPVHPELRTANSPRNLDGNPDSSQAVVCLPSTVDVIVGL